ncbi:kinesin family protein [Diplodia corticola]|uniref:Kinesin family protein n=1 Tax=Diplodia corticola TaxID=236234 RepID=A0A1J9RYT6_9PEZI|nr:kinesin family protein [Diplodia corticola]OJD32972.1 kinesin family protein [Diplodia corticola]
MSSAPTSNLLVDYVSAAVQWRCPYDDSIRHLEQVSLRIVFDESGKAAHFKLRIPASFKSLRKTHIFLSYAPDCVAELHYTQAPDLPEPIKELMSSPDSIASLRIALVQPTGVLVPSETSLTPRNKKFGDVLESVQSLSHSTGYTIFFPVDDDSFHKRASSLCSSIGSLSPIPSELDNASLYNGRGALVLKDCNFGLSSSTAPPQVAESPPSYDELGELPEPSRPPAVKKLKAKEEPWAQALRELRRELNSDMDARLEKLHERVQTQLRDVGERLERRLDEQMDDVRQQMRQEMKQQLDELEERVEEVRDEIDDIVDVRLDDQIDGAKADLKDFVRDQVKDAGEDVKRELEGVRLSISYD